MIRTTCKEAYINIVHVNDSGLAILFGEQLIASLPCHGPMHQEQINVSHIQVFEGVLKRLRDIVRVMLVVPELRRDKELLAGNSALFDGISDGLFGSVAGMALTLHATIQVHLTRGTHIRAVSMWRYPALMASITAASCASSSCQVPKPTAGISAPVLSLNFVGIVGREVIFCK